MVAGKGKSMTGNGGAIPDIRNLQAFGIGYKLGRKAELTQRERWDKGLNQKMFGNMTELYPGIYVGKSLPEGAWEFAQHVAPKVRPQYTVIKPYVKRLANERLTVQEYNEILGEIEAKYREAYYGSNYYQRKRDYEKIASRLPGISDKMDPYWEAAETEIANEMTKLREELETFFHPSVMRKAEEQRNRVQKNAALAIKKLNEYADELEKKAAKARNKEERAQLKAAAAAERKHARETAKREGLINDVLYKGAKLDDVLLPEVVYDDFSSRVRYPKGNIPGTDGKRGDSHIKESVTISGIRSTKSKYLPSLEGRMAVVTARKRGKTVNIFISRLYGMTMSEGELLANLSDVSKVQYARDKQDLVDIYLNTMTGKQRAEFAYQMLGFDWADFYDNRIGSPIHKGSGGNTGTDSGREGYQEILEKMIMVMENY